MAFSGIGMDVVCPYCGKNHMVTVNINPTGTAICIVLCKKEHKCNIGWTGCNKFFRVNTEFNLSVGELSG